MDKQPPFASAVLAIDQGDVEGLRALLAATPGLVHEAGPARDGDYFAGASLLQHVAWNPYPSYREHGLDTDGPERMPAAMPEIVRTLIAAGADPNFRNAAGHDTVELLLTGRLASVAGLTEPILEALLAGGARLVVDASLAHSALENHSPASARALLARGLDWDARIAAGLGELERLRELIRVGGVSRHELGVAALHAYVSGHEAVLDWLLGQESDINATGVQNGTLLHRACADGRLDLVKRLAELGADFNNRDNPFEATPLEWARHHGQEAVVEWVLAHVAERLDRQQAADFGLP